MIIRKATVRDLEDIQRLNLRLFEKEHREFDSTLDYKGTFGKESTGYLRKRIEKNGLVLVAEDNKKIVGYLVGDRAETKSYRKTGSICELENMMILEQYRNMKIGTKLVEEFLGWAKEKRFERIKVTASAQNKEGINFYRKLGFTDYNITLEKKL
ncbi:GNAT family N-acetyltransferase [Candidatus Micrarchaeota archaeon]|nr:GNAT family N-acetyltransferase [Candidatus Micrarchaeota archaeon]